MSKTAYVVTTGDYSDYHICAVFSTEEKAQLYINCQRTPTEYNLGHWEMDEEIWKYGLQKGMSPFTVIMERNGDVESIRPEAYFEDARVEPIPNGKIYGTVYAKDEKHAIKIMNEKRAMAIANGEFDVKESRDD